MSSDLSVADRTMMVNRDLSGARYGRTVGPLGRFGKRDSSRVNLLNAPKAVPLQRVSRQVAGSNEAADVCYWQIVSKKSAN
jgi:hypothetical protein